MPTVDMVMVIIMVVMVIGMGMVVVIGEEQPIGETPIPKAVGKVEIIGILIQVGQRITRIIMFKKYVKVVSEKKKMAIHLLWMMQANLVQKDKKLRTHQNVRKLITN